MRARVPSFADTSLSAASGLRRAAELNPRSALQRKQKIQMELAVQQQRLTAAHSHRRTSQKRMRQATPTKRGRSGGRYQSVAQQAGGKIRDVSDGRARRDEERAFVVAESAKDGTVVVRGGGGRTFSTVGWYKRWRWSY